MKDFRSLTDTSKTTRRGFMKRSAAAVMGARCENALAGGLAQPPKDEVVLTTQKLAYPSRVISWWSIVNDLEWPARAIRDKIQRRADQMAAAKIDVAINFGFHYRFDFSPYFGALHGYLADVAKALHERNIQFMDHFSCNVIARPRTPEDVLGFHTHERHCVNLYPDRIAAREAGYAGYRFNDLREVLVASGQPTYIPRYAGECLCHNNSDFLKIHKAYLRRLFAEVPLDGIHQDDMAFYGSFATCGCRYCREKFHREFGRELPPIAARDFWGDTSLRPSDWGNYNNAAFRDWVRLRYQSNADHLRVVRETIGPDKILMTCCSSSGPLVLNGLGLSAEEWIDLVDWVTMENVGLSPKSIQWPRIESEAMLHKGIAASKSPAGAPAITISYFTYPDGAYLGWAIARFWGVGNWATTLWGRLPVDPPDGKEEAVLIRPFNQWEVAHPLATPGRDVCDLQLAFIRAARDNGWRDSQGRDSWQRISRWVEYLTTHSVGYAFITTRDLEAAPPPLSTSMPLVLDGSTDVSDRVAQVLREFVASGGRLWVAPPYGERDERARPRAKSLLEALQDDAALKARVVAIDPGQGPSVLPELIRQGQLAPRIRRISGPPGWSARLRVHGERLCLHLLNARLQGVPHPTVKGAGGEEILYRINTEPAREPLVMEVNCTGLPKFDRATLESPDLDSPRSAKVEAAAGGRLRLTLDLQGVRLYGEVRPAS
jgi:hypothetical protein